jgi:hypothetical protein
MRARCDGVGKCDFPVLMPSLRGDGSFFSPESAELVVSIGLMRRARDVVDPLDVNWR